MSLVTPDTIQTLQRKLCLKAKRGSQAQEWAVAGECRSRARTSTPWASIAPPPSLRLVHAFRKNLVREPDAGNPHVRFDERGRETGSCDGLRHRLPAKTAGQRLLPIAPATAPVPDSTELRGPDSYDFW